MSIFIRLSDAINEASAINENQLVGVIKSAAVDKKEWLPAITFLERRHPDRWGRKDRTRVDVTEIKTVVITHVEYHLPTYAGATEGEPSGGQVAIDSPARRSVSVGGTAGEPEGDEDEKQTEGTP